MPFRLAPPGTQISFAAQVAAPQRTGALAGGSLRESGVFDPHAIKRATSRTRMPDGNAYQFRSPATWRVATLSRLYMFVTPI